MEIHYGIENKLKILLKILIDKKINNDEKNKNNIYAIIFSGGGIKALAGLGIHFTLTNYSPELIKDVFIYAGTSMGSLLSFIGCIGISSLEMIEIYKDLVFEDIIKKLNIKSLIKNNYLLDKNTLLPLIKNLVRKKFNKEDINFKQLYKKTGKILVINSYCKEKKKMVIFSPFINGKNSIIEAIIMSMSYPFLFEAQKIKNRGEDQTFIDGGIFNNYLIDLFDEKNILGIYFGYKSRNLLFNNIKKNNEIISKDIDLPQNFFETENLKNESFSEALFENDEEDFLELVKEAEKIFKKYLFFNINYSNSSKVLQFCTNEKNESIYKKIFSLKYKLEEKEFIKSLLTQKISSLKQFKIYKSFSILNITKLLKQKQDIEIKKLLLKKKININNIWNKIKENNIFNNTFEYVQNIFDTLIVSSEFYRLRGKKYREITVNTADFQVFTLEFNNDKKMQLFLFGVKACLEFIINPLPKVHYSSDFI